MFSPSKPNQASFKAAFKAAFNTQGKTSVSVSIKFFFPRPKKHFIFNQHTQRFHISSTAPTFVEKTPDIDNCIKLVLDALQGLICSNDSEVVEVKATKVFDHTQTVWDEKQPAPGCTLIKAVQIDQGTTEKDCNCLSCEQQKKFKQKLWFPCLFHQGFQPRSSQQTRAAAPARLATTWLHQSGAPVFQTFLILFSLFLLFLASLLPPPLSLRKPPSPRCQCPRTSCTLPPHHSFFLPCFSFQIASFC